MKKNATLFILALGVFIFLPGLGFAQVAGVEGEAPKPQLSRTQQAYAPATGSNAAPYQDQAVGQDRSAKAEEKYYRSLEKQAKKEEKDAKRVEREIAKAQKAEKDALEARARADRQHEETRNAIDRYLAENQGGEH